MLQLFICGEGVEGERLGGGGEADQDGRRAVPPRPLGSAPAARSRLVGRRRDDLKCAEAFFFFFVSSPENTHS